MLSNKSWGIAGAAMLGTVALLGTNAANAQINLDTDMDGVSYAKETVLKADMIEKDSVNYYLLPDTGNSAAAEQTSTAALGVAAITGNTVLVTYTLTGMVFGADLGDDSLDVGSATENLVIKGKMGDSTATFAVTGTVSDDDAAILQARYAISAGGMGSITMKAINGDLAVLLGQPVENEASYSGAIRLTNALAETAVAMPVTASVEDSFTLFKGMPGMPGMMAAAVGSLTLGVAEDLRDAGETSGDVENVAEIVMDAERRRRQLHHLHGQFLIRE